MNTPKKGFSYTVSERQLKDYSMWPVERRLQWLLAGNRLRKLLPREKRELQDAFRRGDL